MILIDNPPTADEKPDNVIDLDAARREIKTLCDEEDRNLVEAIKTKELAVTFCACSTLQNWWHWPAVFGVVGKANTTPEFTPILFAKDAELLGIDTGGAMIDLGPISVPYTADEYATAFGKGTAGGGEGYVACLARGVRLADGAVVVSELLKDPSTTWYGTYKQIEPKDNQTGESNGAESDQVRRGLRQVSANPALIRAICLHRALATKIAISASIGTDAAGLMLATHKLIAKYEEETAERRETYFRAVRSKAKKMSEAEMQKAFEAAPQIMVRPITMMMLNGAMRDAAQSLASMAILTTNKALIDKIEADVADLHVPASSSRVVEVGSKVASASAKASGRIRQFFTRWGKRSECGSAGNADGAHAA